MASSSVGSDIFALLSLLVISIGVLLLLRHYLPLRTTPGYLLFPVFLALALPCSIILLVPIDLASSSPDAADDRHRGVWLPEAVVLTTWRITYWLTFVLTWFILPFLGEYCDSGFRDTRARVLYSLRSNARYQLITFGTALAGLVYFILSNGFRGQSIKGLVMALAYAWGLVLAIGLMGHGLVALPRRVWRNARVGDRLRNLQSQAPRTKDRLDDAVEELGGLEDTVMQLRQRKTGMGKEMQEWVEELAETASTPRSAASRPSNPTLPAVVTERYIADLTRKLKRARHKKARFTSEWSALCLRAKHTQTILGASSSKTLPSTRPANALLPNLLTPALRYHLHANLLPYSRLTLSYALAAASVFLIFSELISPFLPQISIISLTIAPHSAKAGLTFPSQLLAAAWLLYMQLSTLSTLSTLRVWGNRALVPRATYPESATWYALQVAKLTVPLSYNFITMLPRDLLLRTQFYQFLGKLINLTPLGEGFSKVFPCFVLLPVLATAFNLYGRVGRAVGLEGLGDEDEADGQGSGFGTGGWREGKALIDAELQRHDAFSASLGLEARAGSLDIPSRSDAPLLPSSTADAGVARTREARREFNAITNQEEEAEGADGARHFYQDFGERVKNTFDNVERPEWFKTPAWLGPEGDGGSALRRWFGGRAEDGRLRL
nr:hypothetical protein B0A51_15946 [Rachicladosporium sp. CCFEE 5018]